MIDLLKNIFQNSRRRSSASITSASEESDLDPTPAVARRGRRAAIVDTKVREHNPLLYDVSYPH